MPPAGCRILLLTNLSRQASPVFEAVQLAATRCEFARFFLRAHAGAFHLSTFTTIASLQRLAYRELHILFRSVTNRLVGYAEGTPERREALAALALIRRVISQRQASRPKPWL